ncbi:carcinoembryonic antigen-related cell adhesion molecule 5-like [Achroia grisella]|uniref:carcinoembryonic antigen-related cell adhesion molecule 5-like n=1 Tax=Achroia grisella TaxID=688607 RepID=UPI0027D2CE23|nr:carcinoembryonic antigen-related cell adhesion molecule 5-like [Achroia grisella]
MWLSYVVIWCFGIQWVLTMEAEVVVLRAVRGLDARLPCGQGKVFLDGPESYIIWLKNDRDLLYRFPNDETERRSVNYGNFFSSSCDGGLCNDETSLLLKHVSDQDSGIYRCKVHYQGSPSIDYVIDVRLVDSPGAPKIYNEDGKEIKKAYVGPLHLGADLTLICEVNDEQPDTLVYWRRNGVVIERAHTARPGVLCAEVHVMNITRDELDAHYECLAQNADVTDPLSASVVVKMYLPPLKVEIRLNNNYDFEASQPRVVDCVVVGCVPPPSVTWHLGETLLRPSIHKELHDGNYTVSSLTLAPALRDSKQELVCRAHNSHLQNAVFEDKVTLNVGYRPICLTRREETIGAMPRNAETVTCVVEASPEPLQFSWTFADSRTLYTSIKKVPGHTHRYSSTLTWLPREGDMGLLLCRATNAFGEQKRPCSYTITQGGPPESPECSILRSFPDTLGVQCKKGWDGGRSQIVHLELLSSDGVLLRNVSDPTGHFHLPDVEDDLNMTAVVYSSSSRGRSEPKTLYLQSITPLSNSAILEESSSSSWAQWLEALGGSAAVGAVVVAAVVCIRTFRARKENPDYNPDLVPRSDGSFYREPDFSRDDRMMSTTNITVNQLASCQNYTATPVPSCRLLVGCGHTSTQEISPSNQLNSFYV